MEARELRRIARENLAGNWGNAVLAAFLAALLGGLVATNLVHLQIQFKEEVPVYVGLRLGYYGRISILTLAHLIIGGVIRQGYALYLLKQHDRNEPLDPNDLFSQFHHFSDGFCLALLQALYIVLWSLLFIIPGIVKAFSYSMAPFIMAENPDMTASEAITASKELMNGYKYKLFMLNLSFIGWILLCDLTVGIGYILLHPYMNAAYAAFYRSITRPQIEA